MHTDIYLLKYADTSLVSQAQLTRHFDSFVYLFISFVSDNSRSRLLFVTLLNSSALYKKRKKKIEENLIVRTIRNMEIIYSVCVFAAAV